MPAMWTRCYVPGRSRSPADGGIVVAPGAGQRDVALAYAAAMATNDRLEGGEWTWAALLHRPGAAAPADGSVFDDPRFGDHVAFLDRMAAAGYLVGAGPLLDEPGAGMTILRLPGADRFADVSELATVDDASVASGFFAVDVRPWHVIMTAS